MCASVSMGGGYGAFLAVYMRDITEVDHSCVQVILLHEQTFGLFFGVIVHDEQMDGSKNWGLGVFWSDHSREGVDLIPRFAVSLLCEGRSGLHWPVSGSVDALKI
jgi:hypothetical protein